MKLLLLALIVVFPLCLHAQTAKISIDTARVISAIDPNIYGMFMEPIQFDPKFFGETGLPLNTLYGTMYNPGSPFANKDGFDTRYIDAARELKVTNVRWPGGNYTAGYNWQDGIGPKEKRPVRKELAWNWLETNQVGTDEWIKLNAAIGSENVLCLNFGTGTIDDARYWLEYCNGEPGSSYADLRVKYGSKKPYNIKYWDLGNEVDGEPWIMGYKDADDYCKMAKEVAKIMRFADKNISFIASGSSNYTPDGKWVDRNLKVLTELRDFIDYISIHRYWEGGSGQDYYMYMGQGAMDVEEKIITTANTIAIVKAKYAVAKPIYISFDEWASFGRGLLPTLAVAQYFNSFIRHADVVKMANFTMLPSILDRDKDKGPFKSPLFWTIKMFSNNCLGNALDVAVKCDTFNTSKFYTNIPYLDVTSVYAREKKSVVINVVNRHKEKAILTEIVTSAGMFTGKAVVEEVNSNDIQAPYLFDKQQEYKPVPKEIEAKGNTFTYSFPAHSFTQITVKIE
jgi:alpha-L-arabinofuranosidase